jgi:glucokinase
VNTIAALDLGGTYLRAGWWSGGDWLATRRERTRVLDQPDLIQQMVDIVEAGPSVSGLVVATAGTLRPASGHIVGAANLPLQDVNLRQALQRATGLPVVILGDAVAATVAEFVRGPGRGIRDGIFITVSTGIGAGLVTGGSLISGSSHQAGELGHIPMALDDDAPACPCGQRGCLETLASGHGLTARYADLTGQAMDAHAILRAAQRHDQPAADLVDQGARYLGAALATLWRLFSPEVMVLGGGMIESGLYLHRVIRWLDTTLAQSVPNASRIVTTATCTPTSALVGAALVGSGVPEAVKLLSNTGFKSQLEDLP